MARRPEWNLEPRPDEAVPPSLEAFLAAVACGADAADTIRDQSAKAGFLEGTSIARRRLQPIKKKRERRQESA